MNIFSGVLKLAQSVLLLMLVATVFGDYDATFQDEPHVMPRNVAREPSDTSTTAGSLGCGCNVSNDENSGTDDSDEGDLSLDRIVGGTFARQGEIPWQASMKTLYVGTFGRLTFAHYCGAVIINEYWLLSAAHCYFENGHKKWQVSVGDYLLDRRDKGEQVFEVEKIFNHQLYNSETHDFDVALIKIKTVNGRGMVYSKHVMPIYLPAEDTNLTNGDKILVSGWGASHGAEHGPQIIQNMLKKTWLPIVDSASCQKTQSLKVTKRMFCAGVEGRDTCQGDSGGPAVHKVKGGYYELYGIVSWGDGCGKPNIPGVYSRVSSFLEWIDYILNLNSDNVTQLYIRNPPTK